MRAIFIAILMVCAAAAYPSFDCEKASTLSEKISSHMPIKKMGNRLQNIISQPILIYIVSRISQMTMVNFAIYIESG
ncbi:MAG: hypothetical protein LBB59_03345 [Campylobacteraceae bacterium]|jgi:uncharacterized protein|nr:hypothetical protein [Campylobacteraceae bacterium]